MSNLSIAELFRYHGVWSIGVRMFRNMAFVSKATIISTIFMLVVAQLTFIFVRASNEVIQASEHELAGVAQVRVLAALLDQAQGLRRALFAARGKHSPALTEQLARMDRQLGELETSFAGDVALAEAGKFARDAFTPMKTAIEDREDAFTRADEFVQQLLRLTATVTDVSGLAQDPDTASYHLMLASTHETLQALRMIGRLSDLGTDVVTAAALSPFERRIV